MTTVIMVAGLDGQHSIANGREIMGRFGALWTKHPKAGPRFILHTVYCRVTLLPPTMAVLELAIRKRE